MKKLSIIMATVISLICLLCVSASAANEIKISVNAPSEVDPGSEFTVSVDFSESTGFNTLGVRITYPAEFTYVADSATIGADFADDFYLNFGGYSGETYVFYHNEDAKTLTFVGASLYDITDPSGTLFTMKFKASNTAAASGTYNYGIEMVDDSYNENGDILTGTVVGGSVSIKGEDILIGDINGDKRINSRDALRILKWRLDSVKNPLTEEQLIRADMRPDGVINERDALAILKYELANK